MSRPREDSVPTKSSRSATSNDAGPLDAVKLELAIVLGLVLGIVIVVFRLDMGHGVELALLALAGFGAGGWLAWRTRAATRRQLRGRAADPGTAASTPADRERH